VGEEPGEEAGGGVRLWVFPRVDQVSSNWHPEGGLVVIAEDRPAAETMLAKNAAIKVTEAEWKDAHRYVIADDCEGRVYTFPDAGCC
jgi:hypothetical protein